MERNETREEIFSKSVRAGKRTYFFDVKKNAKGFYYLTVTESKKRFKEDGNFFFEKSKVFLYHEDFQKFYEGLKEVIEHMEENYPAPPVRETVSIEPADDFNFDDL